MSEKIVKTRFAPSPTGSLHVGGVRTALYSYAMARKNGGKFLIRIEDTDRARHQEHAVPKILEDLRWLGLNWDEGMEVGGPDGPYRQSERLDVYEKYVQKLLDECKAYYAFDTEEELEALREKAQQEKLTFRYTTPATLPTPADVQAARDAGRPVVVRLITGLHDAKFYDEVFGDMLVPVAEQDDFIIRKADGWPTYHLANVVDDALMGVTFICRGQEFLGQTWRHVLLREALGADEPRYAHLPLIMDMQGRKLSKRDGDVEVESFRTAGFLPEALLNFLALLGWNPGNDIEKFTLAEFCELFSTDRIGKSNAKFDRDKLSAFNADAIATVSPERLLVCFKDYLSRNATPIPAGDDGLLRTLLGAHKGMKGFGDIVSKCGVLFGPDDSYEFDAKAVEKNLAKNDNEGWRILETLRTELAAIADFSAESLDKWIHDYCEKNTLGMGKVAQPLRIAVTGSTISPGIGVTLALLGKEKTLARIDRCLANRAG